MKEQNLRDKFEKVHINVDKLPKSAKKLRNVQPNSAVKSLFFYEWASAQTMDAVLRIFPNIEKLFLPGFSEFSKFFIKKNININSRLNSLKTLHVEWISTSFSHLTIRSIRELIINEVVNGNDGNIEETRKFLTRNPSIKNLKILEWVDSPVNKKKRKPNLKKLLGSSKINWNIKVLIENFNDMKQSFAYTINSEKDLEASSDDEENVESEITEPPCLDLLLELEGMKEIFDVLPEDKLKEIQEEINLKSENFVNEAGYGGEERDESDFEEQHMVDYTSPQLDKDDERMREIYKQAENFKNGKENKESSD